MTDVAAAISVHGGPDPCARLEDGGRGGSARHVPHEGARPGQVDWPSGARDGRTDSAARP